MGLVRKALIAIVVHAKQKVNAADNEQCIPLSVEVEPVGKQKVPFGKIAGNKSLGLALYVKG